MNKNIIRFSISIISILFFGYILTKINLLQIKDLFNNISIGVWSLVFLSYIGLYLAKSLRIHLLNPAIPVFETFSISVYHNFYLMLLPFNLGEMAYIKKLHDHNIEVSKSVSDMFLMRSLDAFVIASTLLVTIFLQDSFLISGNIFLFTFLSTALIIFIFRTEWFLLILKILKKTKLVFLKKLLFFIEKIVLNLINVSIKKKIVLFLITIVTWMLSASTWIILLKTISDIGLTHILIATLLSVASSTLPISTPGAVGLTQGGWLLGLTVAGETKVFALNFSIIANMTYICSVTLLFIIVNLFFRIKKVPALKSHVMIKNLS